MYCYYGLFQYLPCAYLGNIHKFTGCLTAFSCFYSYYLACKTEPGLVENRNINHYLKKYQYDNVMFIENSKCTTCKIKKLIHKI